MKIARNLLQTYSPERLTALLGQFFASNDTWFQKCGYSLPCFKDAIPKLLLQEGRLTPSAQNASHILTPRRYVGWQRATGTTQPRTPEQ